MRELAYQVAENIKLHHGFNGENKAAGLDWLEGFLNRHSELSLRKREPTSAARAMGFNKTDVSQLLNLSCERINKQIFLNKNL
jgi:hypothetical protein